MYKKLLEKIKENKKIVIFHHVRPDGDAMYSSLALYYFISDNFKDKSVKMAGKDEYEKINKRHIISDKFINDSLAIVVDTSDRARIDDTRAMNAKYIIKIDHHPVVDQYGDINIVETECASVAELVAKILLSKDFSKYKLSNRICEYLYCGMVTDTINFRTSNTTAQTLRIASILVEKGNLKISDLVEFLFDDDIKTYQKITKLRSYLKVKEKFGYIILDKEDLKSLKMEGQEAKNHIGEIGTISDLNIWIFAVEEDDHQYSVSIRSKRNYIINTICRKYNGGGHPNASGIRKINKNKLNQLKKELIELSTK